MRNKAIDICAHRVQHPVMVERLMADAIAVGDMNFAVVKNDRWYQRGDEILFEVAADDSLSLYAENHPLHDKVYIVTIVISGGGLKEGYVALGIKPVKQIKQKAKKRVKDEEENVFNSLEI